MRTTTLIPAALTALAIAGCGITDPYTTHQPASTAATASGAATTTTTTATVDDPSDPRTGTYPPGQLTTGPTGATNRAAAPAAAPATTPQAALSTYAQVDTNWTAHTLGAVQTKLAAISVGQARANALQAAASYGKDTVLQHSQVSNTGQVISIAPDQKQAGVWVVVTSEHTTGQGDYAGLPSQLHVTYARLAHTANQFEVEQWSAQS
jgi:hypothetical protein